MALNQAGALTQYSAKLDELALGKGIAKAGAAMGALVISTTSGTVNTKSISVDSTFTFSATPANGEFFDLILTNTANATRIITIPSSYSYAQRAAITAFEMPALAKIHMRWAYDGALFNLTGEQSAQVHFVSSANGADTEDPRQVQWLWNATDTAAGPAYHATAWVKANPASNSETIQVGLEGRVDWDSDFDLINNGHLIGLIGQVNVVGDGDVAFIVPIEMRFDHLGAGNINRVCNTLITTGNFPSGGTATEYRAIYAPNMSGLTGWSGFAPDDRYILFSSTPEMHCYVAGDFVTTGIYLATSTVSAEAQTLFELQQPNALAGVSVDFTIGSGESGGTILGSVQHNLLAGTHSEIKLNVASNSVMESLGLIVQGTAAGVPNLGLGGESFAGGRGMFFMPAATAPSGTPSGGIVLYNDGGVLKYKDDGGTVRTITVT